MLINLTEEQRNNILGLIARSPKRADESSFIFAKIVAGIEMALMNPVSDDVYNIKGYKSPVLIKPGNNGQ